MPERPVLPLERVREILAPYVTLDEAALGAVTSALDELFARERVDEHRARIDAELAIGRRIQRTLVALECPTVPGWEIAPHYAPAREVGGDFFDVFRVADRRRSLVVDVADVTGKGIAAALLMAFARPLLRAAFDHFRAPVPALERVNLILTRERRSGLFITALGARIDVNTGELAIANAGHEPPLLVPGDGGPLRWLSAEGPLLGMFERLDLVERRYHVGQGDLVLFYTDGVTDARSPTGERLGDRRFRASVRAARGGSASEVLGSIVGRLAEWQAGAEAADDVAIVVLRRSPGPSGSAA